VLASSERERPKAECWVHNLDEKREGERRTMIAVTDLAHVAAGEEKKN